MARGETPLCVRCQSRHKRGQIHPGTSSPRAPKAAAGQRAEQAGAVPREHRARRHTETKLSTAGSLPLLALARSTAGPKFRRIHPLVLFPLLFQLDAAGSASQLNSFAALCCSRVAGPRQLQGLCGAYFSGFPSICFPLQVGNSELLTHGPSAKKAFARELATGLG